LPRATAASPLQISVAMAQRERDPELPSEPDRASYLVETIVIVVIVLALLYVILWPRMC
jgi:hypothetical protein